MVLQEIRREHWKAFFDELSREHEMDTLTIDAEEGEPVTIVRFLSAA